jgi:hypothetical protein
MVRTAERRLLRLSGVVHIPVIRARHHTTLWDTTHQWNTHTHAHTKHIHTDPHIHTRTRTHTHKPSAGRPIFFSLCGWNPWYAPVGQSLGNSWRIGPDDTNWPGVLSNIDINADLAQYAGPGGWNDPCLLLSKDWSGRVR